MVSDEQAAFLLAAGIALTFAMIWATMYPIVKPYDNVGPAVTYLYALMVWTIEFSVGYLVASAIGLVKEYRDRAE